jgi:phenylacetate-CoA ligase
VLAVALLRLCAENDDLPPVSTKAHLVATLLSARAGSSIGGVTMWPTLYRNAFLPLWESGVRRRPTLSLLASLRLSQWRSRDEHLAMQSASLTKLVAHAYENVPFWRHRLDAAGVGPGDVRGLDDLSRLPIVTRRELQDTVRLRSTVAPPFPVITKSTSGSSGSPLVFAYDEGSEHWRQATRLRGYAWAGYHPGDKSLHYWGGAIKRPSRFAAAKMAVDRGLRGDVYVDNGRRDAASLDSVIDVIRREKPRSLVCYAQAGADLARHVNERGARDWGDIAVITGAERLFPQDRAALARAFGPVFETYGSREVMLTAAECEAHEGMHVSMENLIVEVVVREHGRERPAEPGETGEVVITDLHNFGMPFLRYPNGDLATRLPPGRCACGRSLDRLASVDGRVSDTLRDGKGGSLSGLLFSIVFVGVADTVRQFQCVQHADDSITLRIVPTPRWGDGAIAAVRDVAQRYLGDLPLRIELVEDIPCAPSGKRPVVIVEPKAAAA